MEIIVTLNLAAVLIDFVLAGIVLFKKVHNISAFFFGIYLFATAVWGVSVSYIISHPSGLPYEVDSEIYRVMKLVFLSAVGFATTKVWFLKTFLNKDKRLITNKWDYLAIFLTISTTLIVLFDDTLFTSILVRPEGYADITRGIFTPYFSLFILFYFGYSIQILRTKIRAQTNSLAKKQLRILLSAHLIVTGGGLICNWILPTMLHIPQLNGTAPAFSAIYGAFFAYSITSHKIWNLKISLHKVLTYVVSILIAIGLSYTLLFGAQNWGIEMELAVNAITILVALLSFHPIKNVIADLLSILFFRSGKNYLEQLLLDVQHSFDFSQNLQPAFVVAQSDIAQSLYLQKAVFFATRENGFESVHQDSIRTADASAITNRLWATDAPIIRDELEITTLSDDDAVEQKKLKAILGELDAMGSSAVFPVKHASGRVVGMLAVQGRKCLTANEVETLQAITKQVAPMLAKLKAAEPSAHNNSQAEKIQLFVVDANATLQHAIFPLGEIMSGSRHVADGLENLTLALEDIGIGTAPTRARKLANAKSALSELQNEVRQIGVASKTASDYAWRTAALVSELDYVMNFGEDALIEGGSANVRAAILEALRKMLVRHHVMVQRPESASDLLVTCPAEVLTELVLAPLLFLKKCGGRHLAMSVESEKRQLSISFSAEAAVFPGNPVFDLSFVTTLTRRLGGDLQYVEDDFQKTLRIVLPLAS